ncbi:MAG: hypothetical protein K2H49_09410, partial [Muribaculaceae bacterium]|nr:hypothetical protein [Muribaculaceae bacterium]
TVAVATCTIACGSKKEAAEETDEASTPVNLTSQGIWEMMSMDDEGSLLEITESGVRYYTNGYSNMPYKAEIVERTDTSVVFKSQNRNGVVLFSKYDIDLQIFKDGELVVSEQSGPKPWLGGFASINKKEEDRTVYADSLLSKPVGVAGYCEALPIVSIQNKYNKVIFHGEEAYISSNVLKFDYAVCDLAVFEGGPYYINTDSQVNITYDISRSQVDERDGKLRFTVEKAELTEFRCYNTYYSGYADGNTIVVDSKTDDFDAFENADFAKFEPLDKSFDIVVCRMIAHNFILVDGEMYRKQN